MDNHLYLANSYNRPDETGNRRFFPIKTGVINQEALVNHRDRLWVAAAHAYDAKEDYWLLLDGPVLQLQSTGCRCWRWGCQSNPWVGIDAGVFN